MNLPLTIVILLFTVCIQAMELQLPIDPQSPEFRQRVSLYTRLAQQLDTPSPITTPSYYNTEPLCSFSHPFHCKPDRLREREGKELVDFCKKEGIIPTAPAISDTFMQAAESTLRIPYSKRLLTNAIAMKYSAYEQNNTRAMHHIGAMLYKGKFLQQDVSLGKQLLQQAAKTNISAQVDLITINLTEKKYPEATALLYRIAHNQECKEYFRLKKLLEHEVVVHTAKNNNQRLYDQESKVLEHSAKKFYIKALALFHTKDYEKALLFLRKKKCSGFIPAQFLEGLILRLHSSKESHQAGQELLLEGIAYEYLPAFLMAHIVRIEEQELQALEHARQATYGDAFLLTGIRYLREFKDGYSPEIALDYLKKGIIYGNPANFPDLFPYMYTFILSSDNGVTAHVALYLLKALEEILISTDKNKFAQADQVLKKLKYLKNCPRAYFSALLTVAAYSQENATLVPEHWKNNAQGLKAYKLLQKNTAPLLKYLDGVSFSKLKCLVAAIDFILPTTPHEWGKALALRRIIAVELPISSNFTKKVIDFVQNKNNAQEPFSEEELPFFLALSLSANTSLQTLIEKVMAYSEKIPNALPTKSALHDYIIQQFGPLDWLQALHWKANVLLDPESCFKCSMLRLATNYVYDPKIPIERSPLVSDYAYTLLAHWFNPPIYTTTLGLFYLRRPMFEPSMGKGIILCTENYESLIALYLDHHIKKDNAKSLMEHIITIEQKIEHWQFSTVLKYAVLITNLLCHTKDQALVEKCKVFWKHTFNKAPTHPDEFLMMLYKASRKLLDSYKKIKVIPNLCSFLDKEVKNVSWFNNFDKAINVYEITQAIAIASKK